MNTTSITDFAGYNKESLLHVARKLGDLNKHVVFLGGTVLPYLFSATIHLPLRKSKDVDFIVNFNSKDEIFEFEDKLLEVGFRRKGIGAISKWGLKYIHIDILPADPKIISFNNQWCMEAMLKRQKIQIEKDLFIYIITAPSFIGVKLDAFHARGMGDYSKSYDIYDIISLIAGRPEIEKDIQISASSELKQYIVTESKKIMHYTNELDKCIFKSSDGKKIEDLKPLVIRRIRRIVSLC